MTSHQMAWLLARFPEAKKLCGQWWRVALAVAAHESDFGQSHLATDHHNLHGHKFAPYVAHHKPTDDGVHRHFDDPDQTWKSFRYLIQLSTNYPQVRAVIEDCGRDNCSRQTTDETVIDAFANEELAAKYEGCLYCDVDPQHWKQCVLQWYREICDINGEQPALVFSDRGE